MIDINIFQLFFILTDSVRLVNNLLNNQKIGSFQLFHFKVIDYAGLFPPTSLSLDKAIKNYAMYRSQPEKWMLSRFIIPGARLHELEKYSDLFVNNPPFLFSVLNMTTLSTEEFKDNLIVTLNQIKKFEDSLQDNVKVNALELKLPNVGSFSESIVIEIFDTIDKLILSVNPKNIFDIFLELPKRENLETDLNLLLSRCNTFNVNNKNQKISFIGFKLRTGGIKKDQFPSIPEVACVIKQCNLNKVPFKVTAGLHHPIRHFDDSVNTKMHGFINVIGATLLDQALNLKIEEIENILAEENPSQFLFKEDFFKWKNYQIHSELIYKGRIKTIISFGSCSFDEPKQDLQSLKLF